MSHSSSSSASSSASLAALYPLKFEPRLVEKIWGGRKMQTVLGKHLPPHKRIGESWELYDFPPGVVDKSAQWVSASVANGPLAGRTLHQLVAGYGKKLYGDVPLAGAQGQFPILIKFLDAREDLSVQVHPDARYAAAHPEAHLKSEAWYIVQRDENAAIYKGLTAGATREGFAAAVKSGRVLDHIARVPVAAGDCHYLPSGTVHALGAGILVAEVQTPSDTTYRVFDFDRIDPSTGRPRALHVEQALECIDFVGATTDDAAIGAGVVRAPNFAPSAAVMEGDRFCFRSTEPPPPQPSPGVPGEGDKGQRRLPWVVMPRLVTSPFFEMDKLTLGAAVAQPLIHHQPVVWIMLEGRADLHPIEKLAEMTPLAKGDTVLLPAVMPKYALTSHEPCVMLQVTFPIGG